MHTFVLTIKDVKYKFYDDPTTNLALNKFDQDSEAQTAVFFVKNLN